MYKPKSTKEIYIGSFFINSANLEKQLVEKSVQSDEIKIIIDSISRIYYENVDRIVTLCDKDMMALEHISSPLKLFIDCLAYVQKSVSLSPYAHKLIQQYKSAWEDWM
jgi:hypothetical protein